MYTARPKIAPAMFEASSLDLLAGNSVLMPLSLVASFSFRTAFFDYSLPVHFRCLPFKNIAV